ncbi:MAG TPA: preprotein translocase subunit SecA [Gammaproteobacteria bacterium]|nr:preprotein translocase subunit SecA [Gammaproteobacteria bacterium]
MLRYFVKSRNQRLLKRIARVVDAINQREDEFKALSDEALRAKTAEFRKRLEDGATLDSLLPEAFAAVREAAQRQLGLRHYDVQMVGGVVLHRGKIAEMATGEGKTLVSTLPCYLNALPGKGVHIVTVNDYLAQRDADWMRPVYAALDMTVGVSKAGQTQDEKRAAYAADITYGTNNEFGFDYLRDNLSFSLEDRVQRGLHFAIVDEVDSVLIDEARTPLIISGAAEEDTSLYKRVDRIIPRLKKQEEEDGPGDFSVDEKQKQVFLTEEGHQHLEEVLRKEGLLKQDDNLYSAANMTLMHHVNAALRAHHIYKREVDYIVRNGEVVIVDEFTGRTMEGRRWSEGLHQAVEAKEGVNIQAENQTVASITFQNYFRMYDKLAGMTGTADTEAYEFQDIYGLEVVVIPTNKPIARNDNPDQVYLTQKEKFDAIIEDIADCHERGQPVLVGTTSIEVSEYLSGLLKKRKIPHNVLNAKQHEREAEVVAEAGRPGAVTIATNMAGRGTDIVLGGNPDKELEAAGDDEAKREAIRAEWRKRHEQVLEAGGLHIVGTERHESRRIDNQLRGRSGRQGDVGASRFYLSLEDNLMRIFASDRVKGLMSRIGLQEGEAIEHSMVSKAIEGAQRKVEAHNYDIRKDLLEYDNVANDQRKVIYTERSELMATEDISSLVAEMRSDAVRSVLDEFIPPDSVEDMWDVHGAEQALDHEFGAKLPLQKWLDEDDTLDEAGLKNKVDQYLADDYAKKEAVVGSEVMRQFEKQVALQMLDQMWKEHLAAMDHLRQGIHLRGYAQQDPKQAYKREAFEMFTEMLDRYKLEVTNILVRVQVEGAADVEAVEAERRRAGQAQYQYQHADAAEAAAAAGQGAPEGEAVGHEEPYVRSGRKVGRNEPCPCGSGLKYKHCHGRLNQRATG